MNKYVLFLGFLVIVFGVLNIETGRYFLLARIFEETNLINLVRIEDSKILADKEAATAFKHMAQKAHEAGVILVPRSGYRSVSYQRLLINKMLKSRSTNYVFKVLKKPGESEHHTGLAIDIDDAKNTTCSLMPCFENTQAYKWLATHAAEYGFELSYPIGNAENINFEPWHWRYVGSERARTMLTTY